MLWDRFCSVTLNKEVSALDSNERKEGRKKEKDRELLCFVSLQRYFSIHFKLISFNGMEP